MNHWSGSKEPNSKGSGTQIETESCWWLRTLYKQEHLKYYSTSSQKTVFRIGSALDPHFWSPWIWIRIRIFIRRQRSFYAQLTQINKKVFSKNEDLDPDLDPQIFHTLDPDQDPHQQIFQTLDPYTHEMDADPKPCQKVHFCDAVIWPSGHLAPLRILTWARHFGYPVTASSWNVWKKHRDESSSRFS